MSLIKPQFMTLSDTLSHLSFGPIPQFQTTNSDTELQMNQPLMQSFGPLNVHTKFIIFMGLIVHFCVARK